MKIFVNYRMKKVKYSETAATQDRKCFVKNVTANIIKIWLIKVLNPKLVCGIEK